MRASAGLIVAFALGAAVAHALAGRSHESDRFLDSTLPAADRERVRQLYRATAEGHPAATADRWRALSVEFASRGFPRAADYCGSRAVEMGFRW